MLAEAAEYLPVAQFPQLDKPEEAEKVPVLQFVQTVAAVAE
jgi:hypothetical protein